MNECLINDLLDLAKLENSTFKLDEENFNLTDTIFEALQMFMSPAVENQIELKAEIDKRINLSLI